MSVYKVQSLYSHKFVSRKTVTPQQRGLGVSYKFVTQVVEVMFRGVRGDISDRMVAVRSVGIVLGHPNVLYCYHQSRQN